MHKKGTVTTVFVTHDYQEALEIANKIVILEKGQVKFIGNPEDFVLFQINPQSRNDNKNFNDIVSMFD